MRGFFVLGSKYVKLGSPPALAGGFWPLKVYGKPGAGMHVGSKKQKSVVVFPPPATGIKSIGICA
jgi:hypothetical protein